MITSSGVYGVQPPPQQTQTFSSPDLIPENLEKKRELEEKILKLSELILSEKFDTLSEEIPENLETFKTLHATPELRVINEKRELEEKILKLSEFILSEKFDTLSEDHRFLLAKQQNIMQDYSDVLADRILLFTNEKNSI